MRRHEEANGQVELSARYSFRGLSKHDYRFSFPFALYCSALICVAAFDLLLFTKGSATNREQAENAEHTRIHSLSILPDALKQGIMARHTDHRIAVICARREGRFVTDTGFAVAREGVDRIVSLLRLDRLRHQRVREEHRLPHGRAKPTQHVLEAVRQVEVADVAERRLSLLTPAGEGWQHCGTLQQVGEARQVLQTLLQPPYHVTRQTSANACPAAPR